MLALNTQESQNKQETQLSEQMEGMEEIGSQNLKNFLRVRPQRIKTTPAP
jgi:hypothetical protein